MINKFSRIVVLVFAALCTLGLSGCGKAEPKITVVTITPSPEENLESISLEGGWYGYWSASDATGDWKSVEGKYWDCCAEVLVEDDGCNLLLWDEDMPRDDSLAKLRLKEKEGRYTCTGGELLDIAVVPNEIALRLFNREGAVLLISGQYEDSVTGSFCYTFFLRPWGDPWPDTGRRPACYESWYLPKIQSGASIPDKIDAK